MYMCGDIFQKLLSSILIKFKGRENFRFFRAFFFQLHSIKSTITTTFYCDIDRHITVLSRSFYFDVLAKRVEETAEKEKHRENFPKYSSPPLA